MADKYKGGSADFEGFVRAIRDLTARVQRLERRVEDELASRSSDAYSGNVRQNLRPSRAIQGALESRIASQWLNKIGVVAVLFGVAYLLRYAFVRQWISAAAWIWVGVCTGVLVILGSEGFRSRGYRVLSLSVKATGIGVSYLSLWAGLELYRLLSGTATFVGLITLTILSAALALRESAEVLAALALIGGFLTPLLISIPSLEIPLFLYITVLDCAAAVMLVRQRWWKLLPLSLLGTVLLCIVWYYSQYRRPELAATVLAATLFFAIFCATAVWLRRSTSAPPLPLLAFVELTNPAVYFLWLYFLLDPGYHQSLALPALGLAALHFALAGKTERRVRIAAMNGVAVYGGLGITFVSVAFAILVQPEWLSLAWFVEAAAIVAIGFWRDRPWLRWGGLVLLCAAIVKAFAYDVWQLNLAYRTLSFIGLGVLLLAISFAYQRYGFSMIAKGEKDATGRLR